MCGEFNIIYITNIYFDLSQGHYVAPHNVSEIIGFLEQVTFFFNWREEGNSFRNVVWC